MVKYHTFIYLFYPSLTGFMEDVGAESEGGVLAAPSALWEEQQGEESGSW